MNDLSQILPRVLVVSRRTLRKNKFVDFVGNNHFERSLKCYIFVLTFYPRFLIDLIMLDCFSLGEYHLDLIVENGAVPVIVP